MRWWVRSLLRGCCAVLVGYAIAGCPKPTPPSSDAPGVAADLAIAGACPAGVAATQSGVCASPSTFTPDGRACVVCAGPVPSGGCLLPGPLVYCVAACSAAPCQVHAGTP